MPFIFIFFIIQVKPVLSWKVVHKLHARGMFNISSYGSEQAMIWTSAQDRSVVLWPLENKTSKEVLGVVEKENPFLNISTLGGFVYSMSVSSIDSSHVALGVGDSTIRIWNIASVNPDIKMFWNGIKGGLRKSLIPCLFIKFHDL